MFDSQVYFDKVVKLLASGEHGGGLTASDVEGLWLSSDDDAVFDEVGRLFSVDHCTSCNGSRPFASCDSSGFIFARRVFDDVGWDQIEACLWWIYLLKPRAAVASSVPCVPSPFEADTNPQLPPRLTSFRADRTRSSNWPPSTFPGSSRKRCCT